MQYVDRLNQMKDLLDLSADLILIPGTRACIRNYTFSSDKALPPWMKTTDNHNISCNLNFRYPVIVPNSSATFAQAIIMLHGLNERNWNKHLPGALHLALATNRPVILFPLSFHMNRGLPEWSDVRKMSVPLAHRKNQYAGLKEASVANFALSDRLTLEPGRFVTSGYQSANDLLGLMKSIRSGGHPLFESDARLSVFAYSISCMVMQVLMISNPRGILDNTSIFLLAGGCLFSDMQAISRYIMDSRAFTTLQEYYTSMYSSSPLHKVPFFEDCEFGKAFSLMVAQNQDAERIKALKKFQDNLFVAALRDDRVIPVAGIQKAFGNDFVKSGHFREWHFPYPYTHENPFPVLNQHLHAEVESAFLSLYNEAAHFIQYGTTTQSGYRKADNKAAALAG